MRNEYELRAILRESYSELVAPESLSEGNIPQMLERAKRLRAAKRRKYFYLAACAVLVIGVVGAIVARERGFSPLAPSLIENNWSSYEGVYDRLKDAALEGKIDVEPPQSAVNDPLAPLYEPSGSLPDGTAVYSSFAKMSISAEGFAFEKLFRVAVPQELLPQGAVVRACYPSNGAHTAIYSLTKRVDMSLWGKAGFCAAPSVGVIIYDSNGRLLTTGDNATQSGRFVLGVLSGETLCVVSSFDVIHVTDNPDGAHLWLPFVGGEPVAADRIIDFGFGAAQYTVIALYKDGAATSGAAVLAGKTHIGFAGERLYIVGADAASGRICVALYDFSKGALSLVKSVSLAAEFTEGSLALRYDSPSGQIVFGTDAELFTLSSDNLSELNRKDIKE